MNYLAQMLKTEVAPLQSRDEERVQGKKRPRGATCAERLEEIKAKYKEAFGNKSCGTTYITKKLGITNAGPQLRNYKKQGLVIEVGLIGKEKIWKWVGK